MEITYIGHSGFLIEWETCYWLFDYYNGDIPDMDAEKKLLVFVSHKHADHFNPVIFELNKKYHNIQYILSSDIKLKSAINISGEEADIKNKILAVKPSQKYVLHDLYDNEINLKTLKSTDCGIAFLLQYQGKTIYHAGDLNLWMWKEESKQYNHNMKANFDKEISTLKDVTIDIAFAPLDPRQSEWYYLGLEQLLYTANVKYVFPMHFWDQPEIIQQFKRDRIAYTNHAEILDLHQSGQKWKID